MGSAPAAIGDVIADKYSVERVLGEGGMGVVYAARHLELDQRVAIKFLLPEIAQQGMAAERFRREARAAARIRGEHVCRVLDVGTLRGIPYMVMEFLEGRDLADELARRGRLPPEEAVGYMLEACDAVAEAHAAGIVHRDIKPANLFLATRSDGSRHVKVLDFGVSKSLVDSNSGQHALTVTSSVVGSPLYMSPEQLDSARDVDRRTDIWALGVVLYELLTGRTPFSGDSIPQLVNSVLHDQPPTFMSCQVTAPDGLEVALGRALAKQRDQRYASVAEFVTAIAPFATRHTALSTRMSRGIAGTYASPSMAADSQPMHSAGGGPTPNAARTSDEMHVSQVPPAPWAQRTTDRGRRSRQGIVLGALVLLAGSGFLLYRLAFQHDPEQAASGSPHGSEATPTSLRPVTPEPRPATPPPAATAAAIPEPEKPAANEEAAPAQPAKPSQPVATGVVAAPQAPAPAAIPNGKSGQPVKPPVRLQPVAVPPPAARPVPQAPAPSPQPSAVPPASSISDFGGRR
jgi:eukaryotic-like serine/threonine-protein kinase